MSVTIEFVPFTEKAVCLFGGYTWRISFLVQKYVSADLFCREQFVAVSKCVVY